MAETRTGQDDRFPPQIPYIIGNEACERFSFYGMRNILTVFLIDYLLLTQIPDTEMRTTRAKALFHFFMFGVYWFPLVGGWLADRFFGKFRVILWLSLVYCAGHACLALFENSIPGFFTGLLLISVGSGGIKPCVAAMVGDQFTAKNKHLLKKIFAIFYWTINLGSLFASLFIPLALKKLGPAVAFGIPGVLMFVATFLFWLGRKHYVLVPPSGPNPHSFLRIVLSALSRKRPEAPAGAKSHWLDAALQRHPPEAVEGAKAVFRISGLMLPFVPFFWMLFDQKASTWVVQARSMDPYVGPLKFEPSQMQFINPALVMLLIPFLTAVVYPALQRAGMELTPLRRMPLGLAVGAVAYVIAGGYQVMMEHGTTLNIAWQLLPYIVLTVAEILVSTTGLEFAYTQAPREMKSVVQSIWLVCNATANIAVAIASELNVFTGAGQFFFYASFAAAAAVGMALVARRFVVRDYYQAPVPAPSEGAAPAAAPAT
ncbi:MFS transporter [Corallococcus sp. H22C18031201]|uniref:POT-type proton-dependent oligopeptide transporter n=1 Tax=Citreicoccus inhibens TaxID=2849499 RepID=UPI000E723146|nr:MFS transporter [Citreicoccus inhibens]MBU8898294.1 MFS transporter [Citreicoccus inhibens]RJS27021.1 MFS transporter [Corallococcus sp. H22C18031201]